MFILSKSKYCSLLIKYLELSVGLRDINCYVDGKLLTLSLHDPFSLIMDVSSYYDEYISSLSQVTDQDEVSLMLAVSFSKIYDELLGVTSLYFNHKGEFIKGGISQ